MNKLVAVLAIGLVASALPGAASAGVQLRINLVLPTVLPPLVECQPGVRVIQDFDRELFFIDGRYWTFQQGNWYRARNPRRTWHYVRPEQLPLPLRHHRPGTYRHYRGDPRPHRGWDKGGRGRHEGWSGRSARDFGHDGPGWKHRH